MASHLLSVVLDRQTKDTLGFVTCDVVDLSVKPGVLGEQEHAYNPFQRAAIKHFDTYISFQ